MTLEQIHLTERAHDLFVIDRERGLWIETMTWDNLIDIYKNHYLSEAEPGKERKSYESL